MTPRREPAIARRLLNLFCSGPEHESIIGDLLEQYQQGRGAAWYWRQVIGLSVLGLYNKIARRPLVPAQRFPMGLIFAAILVSVVLATALLSDIGIIFLAAIAGGICVGVFKFAHSDGRLSSAPAVNAPLNSPRIVRIDSSKIPIGGSIGAGILILILLVAVLHDLPELRRLAVPGLLTGLAFAAVLRLWRKRHPQAISKDWLSIKR